MSLLRSDKANEIPQYLRMNYQTFRPAMLAAMLELKSNGVDIAQAIKQAEELAVKLDIQARPNDATFLLYQTEVKVIRDVREDPEAVGARMDRYIKPIYAKPSESAQYKYEDQEAQVRFTRPDLKHMHPLDKIKVAWVIRELDHNPGLLQDLKFLALESWGKEYPFDFIRQGNGQLGIVVHKNLMGPEKGKVSAVEYDSNDFSTPILDGHTHPSVVRGQPAKYNNVPSGIKFSAGDLYVARFSRAAIVMSIANNEELFEAFEKNNTTAEEFLEAARKNPGLLDKVKVNFDIYYLDVPGFRKSNLDLGVH
jgi:hypothetical protein